MSIRKIRKSQKGGDIGQIIGATALGTIILLGASQLSRKTMKSRSKYQFTSQPTGKNPKAVSNPASSQTTENQIIVKSNPEYNMDQRGQKRGRKRGRKQGRSASGRVLGLTPQSNSDSDSEDANTRSSQNIQSVETSGKKLKRNTTRRNTTKRNTTRRNATNARVSVQKRSKLATNQHVERIQNARLARAQNPRNR